MPNIQSTNFCIFSGQVPSIAGSVETVDVSLRACEGVTDWVEKLRCWQSSRRWDGLTLTRSMNPCDGYVFDSLVWDGWRWTSGRFHIRYCPGGWYCPGRDNVADSVGPYQSLQSNHIP